MTTALGAPAGTVPALLGIASIVLPTISTFVGLALLLELTLPIPAVIWVAILGAVGILIPLKRPRATSFGFLMSFGLLSTILIAILSVTVLVEAGVSGELVSPPLSPPGDLGVEAALGVIIGILLASYADPVYAVQISRLVLPRDEDGSGNLRGSVAGMAAFIVLTAVFSAVLLFVIPAAELAGEKGSALDPITEGFGAEAVALAFVIGVGLFGIRLYGNAIALFDFIDERLPGRPPPQVALRSGRGRLLLAKAGEAGAPALTVGYAGLRSGSPVVDIGGARTRGERTLSPGGSQETIEAAGATARIEVVDADEDLLRLAIRTDLAIAYDGDATEGGPGVAESLLAGDEGAELAAWLLRVNGATAAETAAAGELAENEARVRLDRLVESGRAEREGDVYRARLGGRRRSKLDESVWADLGGREAGQSAGIEQATGTWGRILASPVARAAVSSIPTALLALLSAVLVAAGTASVSGPFRIVGVIAFATISGVLPPMLLIAARRRAEVAGAKRGGVIVGPVLLALCAIVDFAILVLHATILWSDPIEKSIAAIAALFAIAAVVLAYRHGSFKPSVLVELRQFGADGPAKLRAEQSATPLPASISSEDRPLPDDGAEVAIDSGLDVTIEGGPETAPEIRVSAQRLDEGGIAEALDVSVELLGGGEDDDGPHRLSETGGVAAFRTSGSWKLRISHPGGAAGRPDSPLDLL